MSKPIKKPVWNNIDAIGLLNGISIWDEQFQNLKYVRLPDESNIELRHRINNFRDNPVDGTIDQQLIIGLANELNLDSHKTLNVNTFTLNKVPQPVGGVGIQDIFVSYQEPDSDVWVDIPTQHWSQDVENSTPTSGFIVWENNYYSHNTLDSKTNRYSRLLQIYTPLVNGARLKIIYTVVTYDDNDDKQLVRYTDMSNYMNPLDTQFVVSKEYDPLLSDLLTNPVVYSLNNIPTNFRDKYYDTDGKATDLMYEIQDVVDDNYRCRWSNITDRKSIWDINISFASGTIPSFYDTPFSVDSDDYPTLVDNLTGGVNYYNTALYIKDIDVIYDDVNDVEHWYPVLQPGPLYIKSTKHYLMENPKSVVLDLTSNSGIIPSGVKIQHHTILELNNVTPRTDYIYPDFDYDIEYISGVHNPTPTIARKRPHLTANMGFDLTLNSNEYSIDYDTNIIYSNGITNCILYWDDVDVADKVTIESPFMDLNPINDTELGFDSYFITATEI